MIRLERLLAATDLSAPSRHAAERAALIAKDTGATLRLMHVISDSVLDRLRQLLEPSGDDVEQRLRQKIDRDVAHLVEHIQRTCGLAATAEVVTGALVATIVDRAAACHADLLVLGARGANFMRRLLIGSTAERLVRKSPRPMLVVKQPPHEPYRRLLIAVDFSPSSLAAVRLARAVAPRAERVLLHAYDVPYEDWMRTAEVRDDVLQHYQHVARQRASQELRAFLEAGAMTAAGVPTAVLKGDATLRILEQELELDCDLIVIGKQGESRAEEILLGSVTKHILQQSQSDVLIAV